MKPLAFLVLAGVISAVVFVFVFRSEPETEKISNNQQVPPKVHTSFAPRNVKDTSGFFVLCDHLKPWNDPTSLDEIREAFVNLPAKTIAVLDKKLTNPEASPEDRLQAYFDKAQVLLSEGNAKDALGVLAETREFLKSVPNLERQWLYSVIFFQGVAGLRLGENENCVNCLGEGACIFPIRATAFHTKPSGSRTAIQFFMEYLDAFPDDVGVRWLLNLAHMTLGEYPGQVPQKYLLPIDHFGREADIGRFKDVAPQVGVNRFNQAGGVIMDDFSNKGRFDIVLTCWDQSEHMMFYHNKGDGTFEDRTEAAGLMKQLGGLNLVQTDYNNDGLLDIFVVRGAWYKYPMPPSLLRNNGDGTFTDVTRQAGLLDPVNSVCATWADFDNDGFVDVFICNETGTSRLYRNRGDGTFEEVAAKAGVQGRLGCNCKGAAWIDYDNDGYPDLFLNYLDSTPQLFHNNRNGTFTDVTEAMGITGPKVGFSCWAFDYDNDGWIDIFATCYQRTLDDIVNGMLGKPASKTMDVTRLYRNIGGKRFQDVSKEMGVDKVYCTMGSNFGDFSNDGYLDIFLGTGEPSYATLVPDRMLKNVGGKRFADMTTSAGTGHLQKGHGVACGDWNRDGNVDLFVECGGAIKGDSFRDVLFQNPGQGNNWLEVKLVGKKTNRAAIGARIKVVTSGANPLTVHRHVTSGSSFGANPLQQHIGLAKADSIATLEVFWPTSGTTQVFHDIKANQAIEVTEFAKDYRKLEWTPLPEPKP
jgi:hypothetical protein